jgi:GT2 family glycosyltransferase
MLDVVMVAWNALPYATYAVMHLLAFTPVPLRFIFVDNGSEDDLAARFRPWLGTDHVYIRNKDNLGVYVAINQGLEAATSGLVMWCSTDHLVMPHWFPACEHVINDRKFGWVAPGFPPDGPFELRETYECLRPEGMNVDYKLAPGVFESSLGLMDWSRLKREVGYFDPQFFYVYGDGDYKERLKDAGIEFGILYGAPSRHLGHQSRRLLDPLQDVNLEVADAERFRAKYAHRPEILAQYPGLKQSKEEISQLHRYFYEQSDPKQV